MTQGGQQDDWQSEAQKRKPLGEAFASLDGSTPDEREPGEVVPLRQEWTGDKAARHGPSKGKHLAQQADGIGEESQDDGDMDPR